MACVFTSPLTNLHSALIVSCFPFSPKHILAHSQQSEVVFLFLVFCSFHTQQQHTQQHIQQQQTHLTTAHNSNTHNSNTLNSIPHSITIKTKHTQRQHTHQQHIQQQHIQQQHTQNPHTQQHHAQQYTYAGRKANARGENCQVAEDEAGGMEHRREVEGKVPNTSGFGSVDGSASGQGRKKEGQHIFFVSSRLPGPYLRKLYSVVLGGGLSGQTPTCQRRPSEKKRP